MSKINSTDKLCAHEIIGEVRSFIGWVMKELELKEQGKDSRIDWSKAPKDIVDELALTFIRGFLHRNFDIDMPYEEIIDVINDLDCNDCDDK